VLLYPSTCDNPDNDSEQFMQNWQIFCDKIIS